MPPLSPRQHRLAAPSHRRDWCYPPLGRFDSCPRHAAPWPCDSLCQGAVMYCVSTK